MMDIGTLLQDRFVIEEQIGVGGMGAVYRAVDRKFGSTVAIKETFYRDKDLAEAFEREARLLNGLHHPLFPHVSDHFTEGEGHFLVMEYIEGEDLSELLKRGEQFSLDTVMRWTLDLLDGLDYLHSEDPPIIHRDIKPSNLRLTTRGNLVLLDFGMAKETSGNTQGMRSVFGYSRRYSPLEQIEGTGTDVRSDIFSLGATVYHLLTGEPPVDVLRRASAIVSGRPDTFKSTSSTNPEVPERIAAIIDSALALNPDNRFVSARAMWSALEHSLKGEQSRSAFATASPAFAIPVAPPRVEANQEESVAAFEAEADAEATANAGSAFRMVTENDNDPIAAAITQPTEQIKAMEVGRMPDIPPSRSERIEVPILSEPEPSIDHVEEPEHPGEPERDWYVAATPASRAAVPAHGYNRAALLGIPLLLLFLGLAGYALVRNGPDQATIQETPNEQIAVPASLPEASVAPAAEKKEDVSAADAAVLQEDELADARAEAPETTEKSDTRASAAPRSGDPAAERLPAAAKTTEPVERGIEPPRDRIKGQASASNRNNRSTRPRVAREDDFEQPPVSSIESIMTGVPSNRRQRRWEVWEEDQLRRERRIRRMNRRNRQRDPLF